MTTRTREPELDAEQEVDLGRYASAVAARWWLPVAGLVVGAIIGYLISLGGSQVWQATATVYLGQPYSSNGTPIQSQQTNPSSVGTIVHSEAAIDTAAAAAHMTLAQLRGGISTQAVASGGSATVGTARTQQNPLVKITVQAPTGRKARIAANSLARQVVETLSAYGATKVKLLARRIAIDQQQIDSLRHASGAGVPGAVLLGQVLQDQVTAKLALVQAKQIELPSVLTHAAAVKTTARSRRNDVVVAAVLGFLLGLIAALAWEPLAARRRR